MTTHPVPKGVSLETLQEIVAGWYAAGAASDPQYTTDVEAHTSVSDVVGRQTRFLEAIGILDPHKQKHRLTDAGTTLATALAEDDHEQARAQARDLLADWELTDDVRGVLDQNPMTESALLPVVAALAGQDLDTSRVETGIETLLALYAWAGILEPDSEGRYHSPVSGKTVTENAPAEERAPAEDAVDTATDVESLQTLVSDLEAATADARDAAADARAAAETAREATAGGVAQGGGGVAQGDGGAVSNPHALSIDLDLDPAELEAIVSAVRNGLTSEQDGPTHSRSRADQ